MKKILIAISALSISAVSIIPLISCGAKSTPTPTETKEEKCGGSGGLKNSFILCL